jgi:membrane protein YqaA with SNARE-associated domain
MAESLTGRAECEAIAAGPDDISVRRWFAFYALLLLAAGLPLAALVRGQPWAWSDWLKRPAELLPAVDPAPKLLFFAIYMSLCCTFLPLPTGWIVAAVASREAGLSDSAAVTTLLVAAVGALGSTVANLNDYHLFTWMLRSRRIRRVRGTRLYRAAARWFARAPFTILVIFNIVPIPVDVIRMLATTYRYRRRPFAAANFLGRFVRYGVIAFVTYRLDLGKWAVLVLLALAVALGAARVLPAAARRIYRRLANDAPGRVSASRD